MFLSEYKSCKIWYIQFFDHSGVIQLLGQKRYFLDHLPRPTSSLVRVIIETSCGLELLRQNYQKVKITAVPTY